jgi:hypothetical protein
LTSALPASSLWELIGDGHVHGIMRCEAFKSNYCEKYWFKLNDLTNVSHPYGGILVLAIRAPSPRPKLDSSAIPKLSYPSYNLESSNKEHSILSSFPTPYYSEIIFSTTY